MVASNHLGAAAQEVDLRLASCNSALRPGSSFHDMVHDLVVCHEHSRRLARQNGEQQQHNKDDHQQASLSHGPSLFRAFLNRCLRFDAWLGVRHSARNRTFVLSPLCLLWTELSSLGGGAAAGVPAGENGRSRQGGLQRGAHLPVSNHLPRPTGHVIISTRQGDKVTAVSGCRVPAPDDHERRQSSRDAGSAGPGGLGPEHGARGGQCAIPREQETPKGELTRDILDPDSVSRCDRHVAGVGQAAV